MAPWEYKCHSDLIPTIIHLKKFFLNSCTFYIVSFSPWTYVSIPHKPGNVSTHPGKPRAPCGLNPWPRPFFLPRLAELTRVWFSWVTFQEDPEPAGCFYQVSDLSRFNFFPSHPCLLIKKGPNHYTGEPFYHTINSFHRQKETVFEDQKSSPLSKITY